MNHQAKEKISKSKLWLISEIQDVNRVIDMDPLLIITYNGFFAYIHTICIGMPVCFVSFFSRVFSSCFDISTFVRFLLCNSNKILVIQEIFRWYYKHLIYSLDTISHNCVVRTPHIYKWFSYTQRASYMFVYLFSCIRLY